MPFPVWMAQGRLQGLNVLIVLCLGGLIVATRSDSGSNTQGDSTLGGYIVSGQLPDGEAQVRMRFGNVIVRETTVAHTTKDGGRKGLLLRQVGSGPHFLQLIYKLKYSTDGRSHQKLVECEVLNDWKAANEFRTQFRKELSSAGVPFEVPPNKHVKEDEEDPDESKDDAGNTIDSNFDTLEESGDDDIGEISDIGSDPVDLDPGMETLVNVTARVLENKEIFLNHDLSQAFSIRKQKRACNRLHRQMKQVLDAKSGQNSSQATPTRFRRELEAFRVGIMPGTLWCGDGSLAEELSSLGAHVGADRCCRQHDGCPFLIDAMSSKFGMFNYRMHTISHCNCDESLTGLPKDLNRFKRDDEYSAASVFLQGQLPGTEWCGRGFTAREETTLGAYTGADNCCRRHDLGCPFFIEAFQEKFGLFNWRMYTINHCTCDERFRSCLKQTNTGASNFVGKIFFNVVQTKCFLLKPERVCAKLSWFGKCLKHEYKKQAHLRDPMPY